MRCAICSRRVANRRARRYGGRDDAHRYAARSVPAAGHEQRAREQRARRLARPARGARRRLRGLPRPAHHRHPVPRLLERSAAHARARHADRVAEQRGREQGHDRPVCVRARPLHLEVRLGALDGPGAAAVADPAARPSARLAAAEPGRADPGDPRPRLDRSGGQPRGDRCHGAARRVHVGEPGHRGRRLPDRDPGGGQARRRRCRRRARLPHRHVGGDRRRAGDRLVLGLSGGLYGHGLPGPGRRGHGAAQSRARGLEDRSTPRRAAGARLDRTRS